MSGEHESTDEDRIEAAMGLAERECAALQAEYEAMRRADQQTSHRAKRVHQLIMQALLLKIAIKEHHEMYDGSRIAGVDPQAPWIQRARSNIAAKAEKGHSYDAERALWGLISGVSRLFMRISVTAGAVGLVSLRPGPLSTAKSRAAGWCPGWL